MSDERKDELLRSAIEASLSLGANKMATKEGPSRTGGAVSTPTPVTDSVKSDQSDAVTSSQIKQNPVPQSSSPSGAPKDEKTPVRPEGPVGIDIGTSSIVIVETRMKKIHSINNTKFTTTIPFESFSRNVLVENEVPYFEMNNFEFVQGYASEQIANAFHSHPWRPVPSEFYRENDGLALIEAILPTLIQRPRTPANPLYFSVPGEPLDGNQGLVFHTEIVKTLFSRMGYTAMPINEGLAVVMAELARDNFTGIGISIGDSMCNICLAYLSVPMVAFSIPMGGSYIDNQAASSTGEITFKVKAAKESSFSLKAKPTNRVDMALKIYYQELIKTVLFKLEGVLNSRPVVSTGPIPLVLSGGTVKPEGFKELFEKSLSNSKLPVEISDVRVAEDPMTTVARGAAVMAMAEEM